MAMKKFINDPKDLTKELLEGLALSNPSRITLTADGLVVSKSLGDMKRVHIVTIAGTGYHGCGTYETCDRKEPCLDFQIGAATASCYGADSFDEDVAEAVRLVYNLGLFWGSELVAEHLPAVRFHEDVIPRLMQKIELLAEYRFCSEREAWQARRMLEEYLMAVTSRARGESPEATRAAEGPASGPRRFR